MRKQRSGEWEDYLADRFSQWCVNMVRCKNCGYIWCATHPVEVPISHLQCPNCSIQGFTTLEGGSIAR